MRYQLDQLREVRKSRQEDINEIVEQNAFLSGAHRKNKTEIHEEIQHRLKQSETPQVSKSIRKIGHLKSSAKSQFWSNAKLFIKSKFVKNCIFGRRLKFWSTVKMLVKNFD